LKNWAALIATLFFTRHTKIREGRYVRELEIVEGLLAVFAVNLVRAHAVGTIRNMVGY
jgi:hypothetical protein